MICRARSPCDCILGRAAAECFAARHSYVGCDRQLMERASNKRFLQETVCSQSLSICILSPKRTKVKCFTTENATLTKLEDITHKT